MHQTRALEEMAALRAPVTHLSQAPPRMYEGLCEDFIAETGTADPRFAQDTRLQG